MTDQARETSLRLCDPKTAPTPHPAARLTDRATGEVRTVDLRPLSGATAAAPLGGDVGGGGDPSAAAHLSRTCCSCGASGPLTYSPAHAAHFCDGCFARENEEPRDVPPELTRA